LYDLCKDVVVIVSVRLVGGMNHSGGTGLRTCDRCASALDWLLIATIQITYLL
jgi:hypothetical protein